MTYVPFKPGSRVGYQVDPVTGCWVWMGARNPKGYGRLGIPSTHRVAQAHRYYYEQEHGPIPGGLEPDHLCRNRTCVNPAHIELVTRRENAQRGAKAKLTAVDVRAIARERETIGTPLRQLGHRYGVSHSHLSRVLRGERGYWKGVLGNLSGVSHR